MTIAIAAELLAGDGSEYRRILLSRGMRLSNSVKARQLLSLFIQQGSSDSWRQHVGRYCLDNPLLIVGVCAALAAPLLHLYGVGGFGLHLYGASSTGKPSALYPALSVWGEPNQLRHRWRATANGLEGTALAHNDALLALDEMGEVDPKEAGDVAYIFATSLWLRLRAILRMFKIVPESAANLL